MADIENGKFAFAFGSGMAAVHAALLACELSRGSVVLASNDLYGATLELLYTVFGPFGVKVVTEDFADISALRAKDIGAPMTSMLLSTRWPAKNGTGRFGMALDETLRTSANMASPPNVFDGEDASPRAAAGKFR